MALMSLHLLILPLLLVAEPPHVTEFEGIPAEFQTTAMAAVNAAPLSTDTTVAYHEAGRRLSSYLADQGYLTAETDVISLSDNAIKLVVRPGQRYRLSSIAIEGNRLFPASRLRSELRLPTNNWLRKSQLDSALDNMLRLYSDRSYIRSSATYRITEETRRGEISTSRLLISIDEGKPYRISNVIITEIPQNLAEEARRITDLHSGEAFQPFLVFRASNRLSNWLQNTGYPEARVDIASLPDDTTQSVEITLRAVSGAKLTTTRHNIEGNKKLRASAILPWLAPDPGELFNRSLVRRAERRLRQLPAISSATLKRIEPNGTLVWQVEERPSTSISGALGYDPSISTVGGALSLSSVNLWSGGERASLSWSRSSAQLTTAELAYRHPGLGAPESFVEAAGSYEQQTLFTKWEVEGGVGTSLTTTLEGAVGVLGGRSFSKTEGHSNKQGLYARLALDDTDPSSNPSRGWQSSTRGEWAAKDIHDRKQNRRLDVPKTFADLWRFQPLSGAWLAALRLDWEGVLTAPPVPRDEWLYAGGLSGPRGYLEDQLLGTQMLAGTLELRYRMGDESRVFLFGDWWRLTRQNEPELWYPGYGLGLVAGSDAGSWTIAYGLGRGDTALEGKVHVGFAAQF